MKLSRNWRVLKRSLNRKKKGPVRIRSFLRSWEVITLSQDPQVKWQSRDTDSPGANRRKFAIDVRWAHRQDCCFGESWVSFFKDILFISNISRGGAVVAYEAHNLVVGGSNPPRATNIRALRTIEKGLTVVVCHSSQESVTLRVRSRSH